MFHSTTCRLLYFVHKVSFQTFYATRAVLRNMFHLASLQPHPPVEPGWFAVNSVLWISEGRQRRPQCTAKPYQVFHIQPSVFVGPCRVGFV